MLIRTLPGRRAQRLLIRCMYGVDDYFASKVSQINESGAHRQKSESNQWEWSCRGAPLYSRITTFFETSPTSHRFHSLYIENQLICKKSILQSWYTQIRISHNYFNYKRPKIKSGHGNVGKLGKFH